MIKVNYCPIFDSACQFLKAAECLREKAHDDIGTYGMPAIVNLAIAIELLFKTIYVLEKRSASVREHKYQVLFDYLSDTSKEEIKNNFSSQYNGEYGFDYLLNYYSNLFIEWRYVYEDKRINYVGFNDLKLLAESIRSRCICIIKEIYFDNSELADKWEAGLK